MSDKLSPDDDLSIVENIRTQLEGLKRTPDGALLYGVIERGLTKYSGPKEKVEGAFLRFLYALLDRYADDPKGNPVTRVKAKLAQQRLAFYVQPDKAKSGKQLAKEAVSIGHAKNSSSASAAKTIAEKPSHAVVEVVTDSNTMEISNRGNEPLQQSLVENVTDTVLKNKKFKALLKSNLKALKLAENADDMVDLKHLLVRGMEELIDGTDAIGQELSAADNSLRKARGERQRLEQRLQKITKHSTVDELTGLPKRDALRQQLRSELGRAKRYGFSLALAIIDVDNLKTINERYGKEAGDSVLSYYSREVLAHFRTYDVVARYGGDEFALLFPNTQKEGAQRALEKAQKHAANIVINHDGRSIPLPGFSSVLTICSPSDRLDTILSRADQALDMAKLRGSSGQTIVTLAEK